MFHEIIEAKNNDITRENANMNTDSPAGMMMKFASETTKPLSTTTYYRALEARDAVRHITSTSTTKTITLPRASLAYSILSTVFSVTDLWRTREVAPCKAHRDGLNNSMYLA